MMETPDTIREYWFGTALEDAAVTARERAALWWSKNPEVGNEIRRRFESWVIKAGLGELDHWASNPQDRLALILLTDQFPRSIYRDSSKAFSFDSKALSLAHTGIDAGVDDSLRPLEKVFFTCRWSIRNHSQINSNRYVYFRNWSMTPVRIRSPRLQNISTLPCAIEISSAALAAFRIEIKRWSESQPPKELSFLQQPGSGF